MTTSTTIIQRTQLSAKLVDGENPPGVHTFREPRFSSHIVHILGVNMLDVIIFGCKYLGR